MEEKIRALEQQARQLEPDAEQRIRYSGKAMRYVHTFLQDLDQKPAYVDSEERAEALLDVPIGEKPESFDRLLSLLDEHVDATGLNPASGGHLGYIPGGGLFPSALADLVSAVSNRYAGVFFSSPGAVRIENICLRWLCDLVGYPEEALGNLTSGGSIANLIALVTARDTAGLSSGQYENSVIYLTRQVHHCAQKAFKFAGMKDSVIRHIPMDNRYRMDPGALKEQIDSDRQQGLNPFLIFASAGTTDVGAVDPLREIADISDEEDLWFHVDAAYGGAFLLTEYGREVMTGIDRSDSVTIDPHKGLFLPYGSGAVLVRDAGKLYDSQHMTASYMQDTLQATDELSPADLSPELSKHFRGLRMWLPLKLFGTVPFRAALEEKLWLTRYFYREVQNIEGIEVGPKPELSVVYFRYRPDSGDPNTFNRRLVERIHKDGRVFLSSTMIDDTYYIRLAVLHFRTHLATIDLTLDILRKEIDNLNTGS